MTKIARSEAAFEVEGILCRAWVYAPTEQASRSAPCVVMAHGLGGTRACSLEPYAERFAAAGLYVVLFDYRHLGDSEGEPRQLISVDRQLEDWRAAVAFARQLPQVDPERIGLWGCSLAGGHVIVTAARDRRVAAVSALCPMLDSGAATKLMVRHAGLRTLLGLSAAALIDAARAAVGLSPYYVPVVAPHGKVAAIATRGGYESCKSVVPADWRNEVAARLFLSLPHYRPERSAPDVQCPTLLIACENDDVVSPEAAEKVCERMGNNTRILKLPIGHFDVYHGKWLRRVSDEQAEFYAQVLMKGEA